jgi:hypothetical protein
VWILDRTERVDTVNEILAEHLLRFGQLVDEFTNGHRPIWEAIVFRYESIGFFGVAKLLWHGQSADVGILMTVQSAAPRSCAWAMDVRHASAAVANLTALLTFRAALMMLPAPES